MKTRHPLTLIAAVARNRVIGRNGGMPWHLPSDLAHFRRATLGHPLLMGRKTFESIGRSLPGRGIVVVSTNSIVALGDVTVARTLDEALAQADRAAERLCASEIMVAGGGTIYAALIAAADMLLITAVDAAPDGDTHFPPIDPDRWCVTARDGPVQGAHDSAPYTVQNWRRRQPLSPASNNS